jgi:hypothetical protein
LVIVPVVQIGIVRVAVTQRRVDVRVGMRLGHRRPERVVMLVVLIVPVGVLVRQ